MDIISTDHTNQIVMSDSAMDLIGSSSTDNVIIPLVAIENIVTSFPIDAVIAAPAIDFVIELTPYNVVISGISIDDDISQASEEAIGDSAQVNVVIAVTAVDDDRFDPSNASCGFTMGAVAFHTVTVDGNVTMLVDPQIDRFTMLSRDSQFVTGSIDHRLHAEQSSQLKVFNGSCRNSVLASRHLRTKELTRRSVKLSAKQLEPIWREHARTF